MPKKMTIDEKRTFISSELYHELRCFLGSVTVWKAFSLSESGYDVVVAQDSVFLHARILFEFFTAKKDKEINTLRITEFGPSKYTSNAYSNWKTPLNRHVLHLNAKRLSPNNVRKNGHLNEQIPSFADAILELWKQFEADPKSADFHDILCEVRLRAIADARNDTRDRIDPLFEPEST
jgi:hypothetical protein